MSTVRGARVGARSGPPLPHLGRWPASSALGPPTAPGGGQRTGASPCGVGIHWGGVKVASGVRGLVGKRRRSAVGDTPRDAQGMQGTGQRRRLEGIEGPLLKLLQGAEQSSHRVLRTKLPSFAPCVSSAYF